MLGHAGDLSSALQELLSVFLVNAPDMDRNYIRGLVGAITTDGLSVEPHIHPYNVALLSVILTVAHMVPSYPPTLIGVLDTWEV